MNLNLKRTQCTAGQWKFLNSTSPAVLLAGGFGAGKTLGLALKLLYLKTKNPKAPGILLSQTWRSLWSITYRRLMAVLRMTMPRDKLPRVVDKNGECYLDFGDGVPIFLRSAHDPSSFDGLDVGYALGDEIRHWSRMSYEVLLGRVRVKCPQPQAAFSSTPAMHWMADEFNSGKKNRELIRSPTRENARNLAPDFIENLRLSYSRRMQQAVLEGLFTILDGAVYEAFDPEPETSMWFKNYDAKEYTFRKTYLAVDPGFRRSAWLWIHEIKPTEWIVFDQLMPENVSDDACVQMVNDRGWPIDEIWVDPAADAVQSTFSLDTLDMMREIKTRTNGGIRYVTGPFRSIEYGVDKTRTILGDYDNDLPIRVYFSKHLKKKERGNVRGIIKDIAAYSYPEVKDGRPVTNNPVKDGRSDHSNDAFRNWAVGMWLTSPLRQVDQKLKAVKSQGYKVAS